MEGWSVLDSIYFCVTTVATVGYGDVVPSRDASKLFTSFFAVLGVVIMGSALAHVVMEFFEGENIVVMKCVSKPPYVITEGWMDTKCTTPSLIPTVNTVRSFSSHGQQSAAKGSSTTVSRSDPINSTFGLLGSWFGQEVSLNWLFPYPLITPPRLCSLMVLRWSFICHSLSYTYPPATQSVGERSSHPHWRLVACVRRIAAHVRGVQAAEHAGWGVWVLGS
jgi:hypothetical protein